MRTARLSNPILLPVGLAVATAVCAVLAATLLDAFVRRPQEGGGSITTLLPGFVYASATVMKVCLVGALVSALAGLLGRLFAKSPADPPASGLPVWGIASLAIPPSTLLFGALAVLAFQRLLDPGDVRSAGQFSQIGRMAVFVMLAMLAAGALAGGVSAIRREQPRTAAILGLAANVVLAGLFWHFRFYAPGFDQDLWAPR
ncbi:MAG: hypothetical protein QM757_03400 [Paludibaculum sp.]